MGKRRGYVSEDDPHARTGRRTMLRLDPADMAQVRRENQDPLTRTFEASDAASPAASKPLLGLVAYSDDDDEGGDDVAAEGQEETREAPMVEVTVVTEQATPRGKWRQCLDSASGQPYFWNVETGATTWDQPSDFGEPASPAAVKSNDAPQLERQRIESQQPSGSVEQMAGGGRPSAEADGPKAKVDVLMRDIDMLVSGETQRRTAILHAFNEDMANIAERAGRVARQAQLAEGHRPAADPQLAERIIMTASALESKVLHMMSSPQTDSDEAVPFIAGYAIMEGIKVPAAAQFLVRKLLYLKAMVDIRLADWRAHALTDDQYMFDVLTRAYNELSCYETEGLPRGWVLVTSSEDSRRHYLNVLSGESSFLLPIHKAEGLALDNPRDESQMQSEEGSPPASTATLPAKAPGLRGVKTSSAQLSRKVTPLVQRWQQRHEEVVQAEADEARRAFLAEQRRRPEYAEKEKQKQVENWKKKQLASGAADSNSNFQPLGSNWRERVARTRHGVG